MEGVGQAARGRRVGHHVGVEAGVGRVRPGHGQALSLVLHPPVLEPHLRGETSTAWISTAPRPSAPASADSTGGHPSTATVNAAEQSPVALPKTTGPPRPAEELRSG